MARPYETQAHQLVSNMPDGLPLFSKTEYPLVSVIDALLKIPASVSANFNVLIWADNKNRIVTEPHGRTTVEREVGYSTKEEAFINELSERGNRWRYEKVSDHSDLAAELQKKQFDALVIIGEDLRALALKAVHYLDRILYGPKTVILGFHKRDLNSAYLYGVWSYLKSRGRLHLLRNFAHLNSSPSNPKYLPVIFEKQAADLSVPIWVLEPERITDRHVLQLFHSQVQEGQYLDYKQIGCLRDLKSTKDLLKDFCAMANRGGGIILIGIKENDGRPVLPIRLGLQNVPKSDKELTRLGQMRTSAFGATGPEISTGTVQVMRKCILFIKVFGNVGAPVRPPPSKPADDKYPFRDNQMTAWLPIN
jgi:hypothetical protein